MTEAPTEQKRPKPIPGFTVDQATLDQLSPLHRAAAEIAIKEGRWKLV